MPSSIRVIPGSGPAGGDWVSIFGTVPSLDALPANGISPHVSYRPCEPGDVWRIADDATAWQWDGAEWGSIGELFFPNGP
jgi:hypothetical protein